MRSLLLAGCAAALCLAGCATRAHTRAASSASAAAEGCVPREAPPLPGGAQECGTFGRIYSGEQLRATGAQHLGSALVQTDPGFTSAH
jgi:hypothetical protein